jgi:hypothetical protein
MALMIKRVERPRELKWYHAGAMLYGDWGTSKAYVLGIAFALAFGVAFASAFALHLTTLAPGERGWLSCITSSWAYAAAFAASSSATMAYASSSPGAGQRQHFHQGLATLKSIDFI